MALSWRAQVGVVTGSFYVYVFLALAEAQHRLPGRYGISWGWLVLLDLAMAAFCLAYLWVRGPRPPEVASSSSSALPESGSTASLSSPGGTPSPS